MKKTIAIIVAISIAALTGVVFGKSLDMKFKSQEQTNWCWAATSQAVNGYNGKWEDQCKIVNRCVLPAPAKFRQGTHGRQPPQQPAPMLDLLRLTDPPRRHKRFLHVVLDIRRITQDSPGNADDQRAVFFDKRVPVNHIWSPTHRVRCLYSCAGGGILTSK